MSKQFKIAIQNVYSHSPLPQFTLRCNKNLCSCLVWLKHHALKVMNNNKRWRISGHVRGCRSLDHEGMQGLDISM